MDKVLSPWYYVTSSPCSGGKYIDFNLMGTISFPDRHRSLFFVNNDMIYFLRRNAWYRASRYLWLSEGVSPLAKPIQSKSLMHDHMTIMESGAFFMRCIVEVENEGYSILPGFADPAIPTTDGKYRCCLGHKAHPYPITSVDDLFLWLQRKFHVEQEVGHGSAESMMWIPIKNTDDDDVGREY